MFSCFLLQLLFLLDNYSGHTVLKEIIAFIALPKLHYIRYILRLISLEFNSVLIDLHGIVRWK